MSDEPAAEPSESQAAPPESIAQDHQVGAAAADDQRAGAGEPKSPSDIRPHPKSFFLKRYRATYILTGLFLIMLAAAFFLYPRRASVYRPLPYAIDISASAARPHRVYVGVDQLRPGLFDLDVSVGVTASKSVSSLGVAIVSISLPAGAAPENCKVRTLIAIPRCYYLSGNNLEAVSKFVYQFGNWSADFNYTIRAPVLGWDANGVNLEAQLPAVTYHQSQAQAQDNKTSPSPAAGDLGVEVTYGVPNALGYDWTGAGTFYLYLPIHQCLFVTGGAWSFLG